MKKIMTWLLAVLVLGAMLAGCTVEKQEEEKGTGNYSFYYVSKDETSLKKMSYVPEKETADFMLQDLITRMNEKNLEADGVSLLPDDVQINSYRIENTVLTLEFNSKYTSMSRAREILARAGVVKTFVQIPGITSVYFMAGEGELTDMKGQPAGNMTADSFAEFSGDGKDSYHYDTFTLYFTDKSGKKLVEEVRNVYYRRNLPKARVILEQLIKGPMVKGHYPTIPEATEVLSISTSDQVSYVDFSQAFLEEMSGVSSQITLYSVVNSLLAASDAQKVQILVEGNDEASLANEVSLYNFFTWNEKLIKK